MKMFLVRQCWQHCSTKAGNDTRYGFAGFEKARTRNTSMVTSVCSVSDAVKAVMMLDLLRQR
jgi:hypothetical protein